jgi:hypothetical protein
VCARIVALGDFAAVQRVKMGELRANRQRRALAALFSLLALGFAGIAIAAASSGGSVARRAIVAAAAGALAAWLLTLAVRALK